MTAELHFEDLLGHTGHQITVRTTYQGMMPIECRLVCVTCGRELRQAGNPEADTTHVHRDNVLTVHINQLGQSIVTRFTVIWDDRHPKTPQIVDTIRPTVPMETVEALWIRGDKGISEPLFNALWDSTTTPIILVASEQASAHTQETLATLVPANLATQLTKHKTPSQQPTARFKQPSTNEGVL